MERRSSGPSIAHYGVLGRLASGGMGDVWLARALGPAGFEKLVVLKTIRSGSATPKTTEMFLHEARIAAQLSHPNCVQVFELVEQDGGYFIVMEYIDGRSLGRVSRRGEELERPMPVAVAVRIAIDALIGLEYAHTLCDVEGRALAVVHRDVSLENILVTFSGQTKLVDFGIAKAIGALSDTNTASGVVKGKVGYMAPEYLRGAPIEATADLFSMGVVLYRVLTGKRPFDGESEAQVLTRVLEASPPPVRTIRGDVPWALEAAIDKALAKDPRQRFASAKAMRAALAAAVPHPTDADGVASYLASLWAQDHPERVAVKRLIAGEGIAGSRPALRPLTPTEAGTGVPTEALRGSRRATAPPIESPEETATTVEPPRPRAKRMIWPVAVAATVVAIGAIALFARGRGASEHPVARPDAHQPTELIVADFRNDTDEPLLDGAVELAFAMALEEAPRIAAYPRAQARQAATRLDEQAARTVAVREGLYAVASGSVAKTDHGFAISVHVVEATSGERLAEAEGEATDKAHLLAAVGLLAIPIRQALGDTTPVEVQRDGIAKLTTSSLEAAHLYAEARDLLDNMNPRGASKALQRVLELDPNFDGAYTALAASYLNSGDGDKAHVAFEQAFARIDRMGDRQRFVTRGMYYATQGEPRKALGVYQRMLERFPDDRTALRHLAQTYAALNQYAKAVEIGKRILERSPKDLRARGNMATYLLAVGDFQGAANLANELIALQPKNPAPRWTLAAATYYQGRTADAAAIAHAMQALPGGESEAAVFLGEIALADGRTGDALAISEPTLAADLEHHDTFGAAVKAVTRGRAKLARGDKAGAIAAIDQAITVSADPNLAFEAARVYLAAGAVDKTKAIAARLGQRVEDVQRADARILDGELALHAGRPRDAIRSLTAAQEIYDSWAGAFDLGVAYLEAGAYPQAHDALSACLQRRGELGGFVSNLPPTWYYLARAQEGLKSPAATDSYRTYLAARASADADPLAEDARRRLAALQ